jgi:predicted DCC family thiol-disulfide oxidoreductase YuxK
MSKAVVLYDADCGFCRWSADQILARDRGGHLRAVPLQSAEADLLLRGMDQETKMASWHLVTEDGTIYSAGSAIAPLMRILPGLPRRFAPFTAAVPPVTGIAYRLIARNRERLGRLIGAQACSVDPAQHNTPTP